MKNIVFIIYLMCFQLASAQKDDPALKVGEATYMDWNSGASPGRTGTKYSIKIYIQADKQIAFTNLWIGRENVPFDVQYFTALPPKKLAPGDSLLLVFNRINGAAPANAESKQVPIQYNGAALIECAINKSARYYIVKNFTKLKTLYGE